MAFGEHKSIATDRVILVPGPEREVQTVREAYRIFIGGSSELDIAAELNKIGELTDLGRAWTRGSVHQLLINEKYVGNNVWGRTSFKLKQAHVRNPPSAWFRAADAFEAIVPQDLFDLAQQIIAAYSSRLSDDEMLERLSTILKANGHFWVSSLTRLQLLRRQAPIAAASVVLGLDVAYTSCYNPNASEKQVARS